LLSWLHFGALCLAFAFLSILDFESANSIWQSLPVLAPSLQLMQNFALSVSFPM
jgi:hypothetical protein